MKYPYLCRLIGVGAILFAGLYQASATSLYIVKTIAGGAPVATPDQALSVSLNFGPSIVDHAGNIYTLSAGAVYKIDATGTISRIAGNGHPGYSGDGGSALDAQIRAFDLAFDESTGDVYLAEPYRIRQVSGGPSGGKIRTVAGLGVQGFQAGDGGPAINANVAPGRIAVDPNGTVYFTESDCGCVRKFVPDGAISVAAYVSTEALALSGDGTLYAFVPSAHGVLRVSGDGTQTLVAGGFSVVSELGFDAAGNLYIGDLDDASVHILRTNGSIDSFAAASQHFMYGVYPNGDVLENPYYYQLIRVTAQGGITPVSGTSLPPDSGDGGSALQARMTFALDVKTDTTGNIFVAEYDGNRVRRIAADGTIFPVAGNGSYTSSGDGGLATNAGLPNPRAVAIANNGDVYIAEADKIRRVTPDGHIFAFAGGTPTSTADGTPASQARFSAIRALAFDSSGNLFVADATGESVREINTSGTIKTVASFLSDHVRDVFPTGLAFDASGDLFISVGNFPYVDNPASVLPGRIVRLHSGVISTVTASIIDPAGLAFDPQGNLIIAGNNGQIYQITPPGLANGTVTNLLLNPVPTVYAGDGGALANAQFQHPNAIAITPAGIVYVADSWVAAAIRQLTPLTVAPLTITTTQLASTRAGVDYAQPIAASGGSGTLQWSVESRSLPAGLSLNSATGILSGKVASPGAWDFTVSVSDSGSSGAPLQFATKSFRLYVITDLTVPVKTIAPFAVGIPQRVPLVVAGGQPPYTWSLVSGSMPDLIHLDPNGYIFGGSSSPGTYPISVTVSDSEIPSQSVNANFTISVVGIAPASAVAVANAAGQASSGYGLRTPGEYITIYGSGLADPGGLSATTIPLPTSLNNAQVLIGGKAIPLLYAGPSQINAYVPLNADTSANQLVVVHGNTTSPPLNAVPVAAQPAVYTADLSGSGQAVAQIAGTSLIAAPASPTSAPAIRGKDYLVLYCTGLGAVISDAGDTPPVDGAAPGLTQLFHTRGKITLSIGSVLVDASFAGLTPGLVGLYQVNVPVPAGAPAGSAVPVVVIWTDPSNGNVAKSPTVTVALQ